MTGFLKSAVALGAALMMSMGPALAVDDPGIYQTKDRKMDFELTMCGKTDKDLCVRLLAARGGANTSKTRPYIGKLVVKQAKPAGTNIWNGNLKFGKYDLSGSMTLVPGKSFTIGGCMYLVLCDDITLIPAK